MAILEASIPVLRKALSLDSYVLAGRVLEAGPGHAFIQWRGVDGRMNESSLAVVRGLKLQKADRVLLQRPANEGDWLVTHAFESGPVPAPEAAGVSGTLEARVDGKRITIEGEDEVVLRCGKASITLRRNGRLVIRGVYVESRAKGTHRIKGGSVLIN